jgi:hypothetical protein
MKRKSSSAHDREAKRQEIAQPISFSLESYEDYGGSDEEKPPSPPPLPVPPPVAFRKKPGTKPSLGFEAFAMQQQSAKALLMQTR